MGLLIPLANKGDIFANIFCEMEKKERLQEGVDGSGENEHPFLKRKIHSLFPAGADLLHERRGALEHICVGEQGHALIGVLPCGINFADK